MSSSRLFVISELKFPTVNEYYKITKVMPKLAFVKNAYKRKYNYFYNANIVQ